MTSTERALIEFALRTLNVLAEGEDWDSDTTSYIAEQASNLCLADSNDEGLFVTCFDPDQIDAKVRAGYC